MGALASLALCNAGHAAQAAQVASPAAAGLPPLPDWAPRVPGSLRVLATRNTFLSQNSHLPDWDYAFGKLVDDYSGGVFNPYWGSYGAMVFHGGGHSATFDNSVVLLDLNDLAFKRVSNPTPANGGHYWADMRKSTDLGFDVAHCEYGDGQPGAGHTYDTLAIVPPEAGGAACGSLLRVASFAVHVNVSCNTGWAHRLDFTTTGMRDGHWVRASNNAPVNYLAPGSCSALDTRRKRVWWLASLTSAPGHIRYLDLASARQESVALGAGAGLAPYADPDSATMRYDPVHDVLLLTGSVKGEAALAFLRCTEPQAGWFTPALSQRIPAVADASLAFDQVPEQGAFVLLSPADRAAVYALQVPDKLSAEWTVTRQPLAGSVGSEPREFPTARVVGKRWSYCQAARCFVWMASSTAPVLAYRPLGT